MSRPTALSVAEALEVVRAKSARWASTFDPADGTVLCRRREYARRADGTIVGLSLGRAVARMVEVRRPVVEVAAELQAQAARRSDTGAGFHTIRKVRLDRTRELLARVAGEGAWRRPARPAVPAARAGPRTRPSAPRRRTLRSRV